MLYLFTGNSDYLIKEQIRIWKERFVSKFGDFNIIHIKDFDTINDNFLAENISSSSFLSGKKLIILDLENKNKPEKEKVLLQILNNIPEENIILLNIINPDKRSKFYKKLVEISEIKEFNTQNDADIYKILSNKFGSKISRDGINTIIRYKSGNLSKIISEIEKLLILFDYIDTKEITENIIPELEESVFQVIDNILNNNNINEAIKKIEIILNDTNVYGFYNNLIANLRTIIYIIKLKNLNKPSSEIGEALNLGNRVFLINKKYVVTYKKAEKLYINLVKIDKKMKSGMLNGTTESDFKFELEKVLLS